MKKNLIVVFLFASFYTSFAGVKGGGLPASNSNKSGKDTIVLSVDHEEATDYVDSLLMFPAYDLYCDWDTINTHYTKFDVESLKDEVKEIVLFDKNSCGYVHPFDGNVTSGFGPRKRIFHYGADIDLETGDAVSAAFDGKVRIARRSKTYGNVVVIRHSNGLETYYAHLSKINVEVGQEIFAGQVIGLGGNTGHSFGSHLHFEVRYLGQPINPSDIISFTDHKLVSDTLCLSKDNFNYITEAKKVTTKTYASSKRGSKVYVVKKGDTWYGIAKRYGSSADVLSRKNGRKASSVLKKGQKIRL